MQKWVTAALKPLLRPLFATSLTNRATVASTTTTTSIAKTTATRRTTINITLTVLIVSALFVQAASGLRSIETAAHGGGRKLFGGYRITPKHCRATRTLPSSDPRSTGPTICMFNHECAQRDGEVVGACMDGFLFGACCQIPSTYELSSTLITDAQNIYYQQYQQHKLHVQQALTNPAAALSYENYGENQQQQTSHTSYQTKYTTQTQENASQQQNMETSSISYVGSSVPSANKPNISSGNYATVEQINGSLATENAVHMPSQATASSQQQQQQDNHNKQPATTEATYADIEIEATLPANNNAAHTNVIIANHPKLPTFQVHKHSVKVSSPSSPLQSHNDDFVVQVLSTLPTDHSHDVITFTTEVPNKISSNIGEHYSSESNSFEEIPTQTQTQTSVKLTYKPTKQAQKPTQTVKQTTVQSKPQKMQPKPTQPTQPTQSTTNIQHNQHQNQNHNHNLLLDGTEFTHSDITHPGADADLLEDDLQFSTGYGPQPVFIKPPKSEATNIKYTISSSTHKIPTSSDSGLADNKYVLVQTISNDKSPTNASTATTISSITTHADSIESIILQLNNTSHGPSYNVVSQQTPSYGYDVQHATASSSYSEAASDARPAAANPISSSQATTYYHEIETKRPDAYLPQEQHIQSQLDYTATASYEKLSDEQTNEYQYNKPTATSEIVLPSNYNDDTATVLEEQTVPANSYNDAIAISSPQTSHFNKMPAVGIAYPVDMSHMVDEMNLAGLGQEQSAYTQVTSESPTQTSTEIKYQEIPEQGEAIHVYNKPVTIPIAQDRPHLGMISIQNYYQQPQNPLYSQVPAEVSVSSQATQVQEQNDTATWYQTSSQSTTGEKFVTSTPTTTNYGQQPTSTVAHISSTSIPLVQRPQYNGGRPNSSTVRPVLITANPKPRPQSKPSTRHPDRQPPNNDKTRKPQTTQTSTNNYNQIQSQSVVSYEPQEESNVRKPVGQPAQSYNDNSYINVETPSSTYNNDISTVQPNNIIEAQPNIYNASPTSATNSDKYDATSATPSSEDAYSAVSVHLQQQHQPAQPVLTYNQDQQVASSPTKHSSIYTPTNKKPSSTSYVTGPTSAKPAPSINYHYDKVPPLIVADDKLDSLIHSTAVNILGYTPANYQPPVYVTASTPTYAQSLQNSNNNINKHKKPGFVKVNPTIKAPTPTVLITPKPTGINLVTSSTVSTNEASSTTYASTTPISTFGSTSYIYNPSVTRRPVETNSTPDYPLIAPVMSNDFEDPGYFNAQQNLHAAFTQSTTEAVFAVPSDDKPAFPGYYGPTPTYPTFSVPGEKGEGNIEEETYTSPNDFVNFPPVRNPNLNMSAVSSAVTSDLELSTPTFVEDVVLKDKMNTLVQKLVASLQDNFEALADLIDENNVTAAAAGFQSGEFGTGGSASTTATRKPTRKPTRFSTTTIKPKSTTKKSITRVTTKTPTKKTSATTRKPTTKRPTNTPTTTTRKPVSRKPTRRVTTTSATTISTARPADEDIADEEDGEDINPNENEVDQDGTLDSYGANGRKIQCGVRPHVKSGRIVGGKGSTFGAYPWQVLVRESTWLGLFTKNKCGGVLITNRYVITAAHCQPGFLASLVAVMGEFDISGDLESKRSVTKNVKRVIVHRQYDPATFENDLALLELESPVQFDTHIVPICMPNDGADFTGRMASVTGWGRLKYGGGVPSVLQEVQVPIIENSVCQEMFHTAGHNKKILNSFLCAGYANGQKDSCEGDSGGPLVLQRPDGRYELAGTVSHGIKCAAPYLPGVYMRTTFYKPWLQSITGVK